MGGQQQGTEGFKIGNLKRQLATIPLVTLSAAKAGDVESNDLHFQLWLSGLNANLKLLVAAGIQSQEYTSQPFPWVNGLADVQIYPVTKFADATKVFLRPVFQDPTNTTNTNAPQPQDLPFGWEGSFTVVDQVMIEVVVHPAQWAALNVNGQISLQVAVEYDGAWWDVSAMEYAMGQVQLQGIDNPATIGTGGE